MKKILIIISLVILSNSPALMAQSSDYKVVFDLTSKDSIDHKMVIRWLNEILQSDPASHTEVVLYGKSLDMVVKGRSTVSAEVLKLAQNKNIAFRVCAIAMKNNNIQPDQLLTGVKTVPDGIYELISKQKQNWGYIKVSH